MIRGPEYSGLPRILDISHDLIRIEALQLKYAKRQGPRGEERKQLHMCCLVRPEVIGAEVIGTKEEKAEGYGPLDAKSPSTPRAQSTRKGLIIWCLFQVW